MPSGSRDEAEKRIPIIEEEINEVNDIILRLFIEIDVAIHTEELKATKEPTLQINQLQKRRDALKKLLEKEKDIAKNGLSDQMHIVCKAVIN